MTDTSQEKILATLSPLAPVLAQVHRDVDNIHTLYSSVSISPDIRNTLTLYHTVYSRASPAEKTRFLEQYIFPRIEAGRIPGESAPDIAAKTAAVQEIVGRPLASDSAATLTAQFVHAGVPISAANELALLLVTHRVDKLAYAIADHAPLGFRAKAYADLLVNAGLPFAQEQLSLSPAARQAADFLQQNPSRIDANRIYTSIDQEYSSPASASQLYQPRFFQSSPNDLAPFMNFLYTNPLSEKLKSQIGKAAVNSFLHSAVGQQVTDFAVKKLGPKVVSAAISKLGGTTAASVIGTPIAGTVYFVASEILTRISTYVKKHSKEFLSVAAGLGAILIFGSVTAGVTVFALTLGTLYFFSASLGGLGAFGSGSGAGEAGIYSAASRIGHTFNGLAGNLVTITITPIVITILVLPVVIALFIFIINTGAYVVPPGSTNLGTNTPHCWPTHGQITQGPGCAQNFDHCSFNEDAIDIANIDGTPIYATHNGIAHYFADTHNCTMGYGNYVVITSPDGFSTLYAHMPAGWGGIDLNGQTVTTGTQIGIIDNCGYSFGPHLHYEYSLPIPAIDQIVPPYTYLGQTTGCFAQDQKTGP